MNIKVWLTQGRDRLTSLDPENISKNSNWTWVGGKFFRPYTPNTALSGMVKLSFTKPGSVCLYFDCQNDLGGIFICWSWPRYTTEGLGKAVVEVEPVQKQQREIINYGQTDKNRK